MLELEQNLVHAFMMREIPNVIPDLDHMDRCIPVLEE
jgi:hypothetical protein